MKKNTLKKIITEEVSKLFEDLGSIEEQRLSMSIPQVLTALRKHVDSYLKSAGSTKYEDMPPKEGLGNLNQVDFGMIGEILVEVNRLILLINRKADPQNKSDKFITTDGKDPNLADVTLKIRPEALKAQSAPAEKPSINIPRQRIPAPAAAATSLGE